MQIKDICDFEIFTNSQIKIIPYVYAWAGYIIGKTMTTNKNIKQNLVGVEIGCGVEDMRINE